MKCSAIFPSECYAAMSSDDPEVTSAPARLEPLTSQAAQSHSQLDRPARPAGIVLVVSLFALLSVCAFAFAVLFVTGVMPLSYGSLLLPNGLEQAGPLAFLFYGAVVALVAIGLWRGYNWSRRGAVFIASIGVALVVPGISSAVVDGRLEAIMREGLQIMVRVAVVFYLSQEPVKEWFATRRQERNA